MATKRMFTKDVARLDWFLDMPLSAQALYFHLCLDADVKGFVTPRQTMRLINAQPDDLTVLVAKGFIYPFETGVIVVKHWNVHNNIREDYEAPTQFVDELKKLTVNKDKTYSLQQDYSGTTEELRDSIDKIRLDKISLDKTHTVTKKWELTTEELQAIQETVQPFDYSRKDIKFQYELAQEWLADVRRNKKRVAGSRLWFLNWLRKSEDVQSARKGGVHVIS